MEHLGAESQPRHDGGSKVLDQHVGRAAQLQQELPAALGLEVQHDGALTAVQRSERIVAVARTAPRHVASRRLDLDDVRSGHRHQEGGIRTLKDVAEIEHADAGQREREGGRRLRSRPRVTGQSEGVPLSLPLCAFMRSWWPGGFVRSNSELCCRICDSGKV